MNVSLIVSTYNRPDALEVCLDSIRHQTVLPDEVVIGDDGSKDETKELIERMKAGFPVPIVHVWQEDNGFRLAMMRNKSVAAASGNYIIEIDGDVFLHPRFVEDHIRLSGKGIYVKGGRVNLNRELTGKICLERRAPRIWPWTKGIESKPENGFHFKHLSSFLAPRYRKHASPGLGCNMSFYKEDYIRINGYDEFFEGWGGEDYDFANRLLASGCVKRYLKFAGIVYHLWHEDKYMQNADKNFKYMEGQNSHQVIRCTNGVDKYL